MWRSNLIAGLRALQKNRTYAFINIFGLAIGLAACIVLLLYVRYELSYDEWLPDADRTYQVQLIHTDPETGVRTIQQASEGAAAAPLAKDFPQIEAAVRADGSRPVLLRDGEPVFADWLEADPAFFQVISVPFLRGDPHRALDQANSLVMSRTEAIKQFQRSCGEPPAAIVDAVHRALRHTRGGAVAAARIGWASRTVSFAGVGNIAGVVVGPGGQLRRMVSHNGTAGHMVRKIQSFDYPCGQGPMILHSDGIASSWSLDAYAGLARAHPLLLAGVLYRDFARPRDDATVVVASTVPA